MGWQVGPDVGRQRALVSGSCSSSDVGILGKLSTIHGHPNVCVNSASSNANLRRVMFRIMSGTVSRTLTNRYGRVVIAVRTSGSISMRSSKHNVPANVRPRRNMSTTRIVVAILRTNNGFSSGSCGISNNLRNINISMMGTLSRGLRLIVRHRNGVRHRVCRRNMPRTPLTIANRARGANAVIHF